MKKILLISPNQEKTPPVFALGIGYLYSVLVEAGFEVGILDFLHIQPDENTIIEYLNSFKPDMIGISIRNIDNSCMQRSRSFIDQYRILTGWIRKWNNSVLIILGGSGFSIFPEMWLSTVKADYGMVGDNLKNIEQLFKDLSWGNSVDQIPGLVCFNNGKFYSNPSSFEDDLDSIPFPSRTGHIHSINNEIKIRHNIQSKKGCQFNCIYCSYPSIEGKKMRLRSAKNIVDEIYKIQNEHDISDFDFADSVFNYPMEHAISICEEIIKRKIKISWSCFLHPKYIMKELFKLFNEAGCNHIEIGVDSASSKCLEILNKGFNKDDIRNAVNFCRESNIPFNVCLLFGTPGETIETVYETLNFMDSMNIDQLFGLIGIRVLPDTAIFKKHFDNDNKNDFFNPKFIVSDNLNIEEMKSALSYYLSKHPEWVIL